MRLLPSFVVVTIVLISSLGSIDCQLRFGSNGLKLLPPINLATVFRILKKTWSALTSSSTKQISPIAKEGRGATKAENRIGNVEDVKKREEIIAKLSDEEKLILNELKIKVKISCYSHNIDCNDMTMENYINNTKTNLTEEERNATLKLTNSSTLDFQVSELIDTRIENKITEKDDSNLEKAPKTPSFWPYPFASGGWLASYIALNSVLMALYIFLSWPYFMTGRVVDRLVKVGGDEETETTTIQGTMTEEAMDQLKKQYMGYTSYGDSDMFMSYMMSEDEDETTDDDKQTENGSSEITESKTNGEKEKGGPSPPNSSGETTQEEEGGGNGETKTNGETSENGNNDSNKMKDDDKSQENEEDNKIKDDKDEYTKCIENIMCLRPVYGARALSSASLALKLLEWVPGLDSFGRRFKRNVGRFGRAIQKGRINDCYDYFCPKDKKNR